MLGVTGWMLPRWQAGVALMAKRVWVTGAGGMVGRSVVEAFKLQRPGWPLLAPDRTVLDLGDREAVRDYLEVNRPDLVVHAAGRVGGIAANIANPVEFLMENLEIGVNVIGESRRAGVPNLINISSSCVYPKNLESLLREDFILTGPLEPTNEGYAIAKLAADRLCEYVSRQDGLNFRTLIPSNLYGPGDHFDDHRGHLVANIIRKIDAAVAAGEKSVVVWGDGESRREFTFVRDVADYVVQVANPQVLAGLPQRMNIGVGVDHSVTEFYRAVADLLKWDGDFVYDLAKPSGMRRKLMDSSLARGYGWQPQTELDEGLRATYEYFRRVREGIA